MIVFWALFFLMFAYGLGTLQGMSPEVRKALFSRGEDGPADHSIAWILALAIVVTIVLAAVGQI